LGTLYVHFDVFVTMRHAVANAKLQTISGIPSAAACTASLNRSPISLLPAWFPASHYHRPSSMTWMIRVDSTSIPGVVLRLLRTISSASASFVTI
jgi:hypothetical protein